MLEHGCQCYVCKKMSKLCSDLHHENEETSTPVGLACNDVATAGSTSRFFIRLISVDLCARISVG